MAQRNDAKWLLKTEPSTYSWEDLVREKRTTWDGVSNPAALRNLAAMSEGDLVFIYHTGDVKAALGTARVVRAAYPDPKLRNTKRLVVDLEALAPLGIPVSLHEMKAMPEFTGSPLARQGRLSVVPLTPEQARAVARKAGA